MLPQPSSLTEVLRSATSEPTNQFVEELVKKVNVDTTIQRAANRFRNLDQDIIGTDAASYMNSRMQKVGAQAVTSDGPGSFLGAVMSTENPDRLLMHALTDGANEKGIDNYFLTTHEMMPAGNPAPVPSAKVIGDKSVVTLSCQYLLYVTLEHMMEAQSATSSKLAAVSKKVSGKDSEAFGATIDTQTRDRFDPNSGSGLMQIEYDVHFVLNEEKDGFQKTLVVPKGINLDQGVWNTIKGNTDEAIRIFNAVKDLRDKGVEMMLSSGFPKLDVNAFATNANEQLENIAREALSPSGPRAVMYSDPYTTAADSPTAVYSMYPLDTQSSSTDHKAVSLDLASKFFLYTNVEKLIMILQDGGMEVEQRIDIFELLLMKQLETAYAPQTVATSGDGSVVDPNGAQGAFERWMHIVRSLEPAAEAHQQLQKWLGLIHQNRHDVEMILASPEKQRIIDEKFAQLQQIREGLAPRASVEVTLAKHPRGAVQNLQKALKEIKSMLDVRRRFTAASADLSATPHASRGNQFK